MSVANDLIPRTGAPEDNPKLEEPGREGVIVDEMAYPSSETKSVVKESIKCRADRLLDWMRWRLILEGHFKLTYAETGERTIGDYEIEVVDLKEMLSRLEEDPGEAWRFFMTSGTRRTHLEPRDRDPDEPPLVNVTNGQLIIVDSGYMDGRDHQQSIPDDVIVVVKGPDPVGRMFSTGRVEKEDMGSLEREYVQLTETVLPELTAPERIFICRF